MKNIKNKVSDFLRLNINHFDFVNKNLGRGFGIRNFNFDKNKGQIVELLKNIDLASLKALQRLTRLVAPKKSRLDGVKKQTILNLYNAGLHSAYQIASIPKHKFVKKYASCFANEQQAKDLHKAALASKSHILSTYMAIAQQTNPFYCNTRFDNLSQLTDSNFSDLPSYENLFGGLDFCDYPNYRTIYSPAAYFVDLMRVVEDYITPGLSTLSLATRRPDLANLPLSASNTDGMVSKVEIINSILVATVASATSAIETKYSVAINNDISKAIYPFNLPFNVSVTQSGQYLQQNKLSLPKIWQELISATTLADNTQPEGKNFYLQQLGITQEQWTIFTTVSNGTATPYNDFYKYYGFLSVQNMTVALFSELDKFLPYTKLDYLGLNELLNEDLTNAEITANPNLQKAFFINSITPAPTNVIGLSSDGTSLTYCSSDGQSFYRIHRFIRLANALNWSFTDLDWALYNISQSLGIAIEICDQILPALAWMKVIQNTNNLTINQICAFLNLIKNQGQANGQTFYQQLFDSPLATPDSPFINTQNNAWNVPKPGTLAKDIQPNDQNLQDNLSIALRLNNNNLLAIAWTLLAIKNPKEKPLTTNTLTLDIPTLSLFYRISLLPTITGMTLTDLMVLYSATTSSNLLKDYLSETNVNNLISITNNLIAQAQLLQQNKLSVYRLQYWLTGQSYDLNIQNKIINNEVATNFVTNLCNEINSITFSEAQLLQNCGNQISELGVAGLADAIWSNFASNVVNGIVVTIPTVSAISTYIATKVSGLSDEITAVSIVINSTFTHYNSLQQQTFCTALGTIFKVDQNDLLILAQLVNLQLQNITTTVNATLLGQLRQIQIYVDIINNLNLSSLELNLIDSDPSLAGITTGSNVSFAYVSTLYDFVQLKQSFDDRYDDLLTYLATNPQSNDPNLAKNLAPITNWDVTQLTNLISDLWPSANPAVQIGISQTYLLYSYFSFAQTLQCSTDLIMQAVALASSYPADTQNDYNVNWQLFAAQIGNAFLAQNQNNLNALATPINNTLNHYRGALMQFAIYFLNLSGATAKPLVLGSDLSEYLLTDVEVDAMVQSSYVVEATSSVQTYIYRCCNYIEEATVEAELNDIWPWMQNYRLWQANREIFLYPENYIEPELRKNKTTLFTKLQNDLQQGSISDDSVTEGAMRNYLDSLAQVANLNIVNIATSNSISNQSKNIFIVGIGNTNPTKYYYLTATFVKDVNNNYTGGQWGEWLPINCDLQPLGPNTNTKQTDVIAINPVFAFGKWFIFWMELAKVGGAVDSTGDATSYYQLNLQYSSLNNAQNWSSKQTLVSYDKIAYPLPSPNPDDYIALTDFETAIYPVYVKSLQTLFVYYQDIASDSILLYKIGQQDLSNVLLTSILNSNTLPSNLPTELNSMLVEPTSRCCVNYYPTFAKAFSSSSATIDNYGFAISTWFCLDSLPSSASALLSCQNFVNQNHIYLSVNQNGDLLITDDNSDSNTLSAAAIAKNNWYNLVISYPVNSYEIQLSSCPELISNVEPMDMMNENFYILYLSISSVYFGLFTFSNGRYTYTPNNSFSVAVNVGTVQSIVTRYYGGAIYFAVLGTSGIAAYSVAVSGNQPSGSATLIYSTSGSYTNAKLYFFGNSVSLTYFSPTNKFIYTMPLVKGATPAALKPLTFGDKIVQISALIDVMEFNDTIYFLVMTPNYDTLLLYLNFKDMTSLALATMIAYDGNTSSVFLIPSSDGQTLSTIFPTAVAGQYCINWCIKKTGQGNQITNNTGYQGTTIDLSKAINFSPAFPITPGTIFTIPNNPNEDELGYLYVDTGTNSFGFSSPKDSQVEIYLNGQKFLVTDSKINSYINTNFSYGVSLVNNLNPGNLSCSMQETVQFTEYLEDYEIISMYNSAADLMVDAFDNYVSLADCFAVLSQNFSPTFFPSQPNWSNLQVYNISLLNIPITLNGNDYLQSIRLNSTAVPALESNLSAQDIAGLLSITSQLTTEANIDLLLPQEIVTTPSPTIDFSEGPMSNYYWELFFYAPFYIARQLQNQQLFEDSKKWFEYIFNPAIPQNNWDLNGDSVSNDKYWRFVGLRSFYNPTLSIELGENWASEMQDDMSESSVTTGAAQIYDYHNDPFDPNAIARLRPIAYQKTIIMHYVANIMAWADNLYTQFNEQSIAEATMLYMTVSDLLGSKPQNLGACPIGPDINFATISSDYPLSKDDPDPIPEFIIEIEQTLPPAPYPATETPVNYIANAYFGLPQNDQLNSYWDQVNQRLYNIRHGLNIDGIFEQIPLFAPEINPMQLVQQLSSGQSLEQALSAINTTIPYYRFKTVIEKAKEVTNLVIEFGQSLLSALEKKDAEQLVRMYNLNQQNITALTNIVKQNELNAATQNLQSLQASLKNAQDRYNYYSTLISDGLSEKENNQISNDNSAVASQILAQEFKAIAAGVYLIPNIFGLADGGSNFGESVVQGAGMAEGFAQAYSMTASSLGNVASYERRAQDWGLQQTIASDDISQIQFQILGAQYQQFIAQQEITILQKDLAQQQAVYQFLASKFSSQEMYQWLAGQLSALYFQSYKLAYKLAKQAEQAWIFERGLDAPNTPIFQPSYWNNLYQGLSCGESLMLDIQRCEQAYMDQNNRRLEITKTISFANATSGAANGQLAALKALQGGANSANFSIQLADLESDYPNQVCRQIKTISLSFPTLLGPYQDIHAILTQTSNTVVTTSGASKANYMTNQQIAISQGIDDHGMVVLNFDDERYLPFEGTGVISGWTLSIPAAQNPNIAANLTDIIMKVTYTAVPGSGS